MMNILLKVRAFIVTVLTLIQRSINIYSEAKENKQ